jgi:multicomponent Na+:H+ antiporter subunit E
MLQAAAVAILFAFWVLMSGHFTPFLLAAGLGTALAVLALARRMRVLEDGFPIGLGVPALTYWPWLGWEIVKSAWAVTRIILSPRMRVSPVFVRVKPTQASPLARVTYANSITLTPGTITVEADEDEFLVHALTEAGAEDLAGGEMDRRVTAFERRAR